MILNSLKLIFYSFFNKVYAYTPHWASTNKEPNENNLSECAGMCEGREGIVINEGKVCVCSPKAGNNSGFDGAQKDTSKIFDTLLDLFMIISNIGAMMCIMSLVWGAIQFATSEGQQQKKVKAQDRIKISLIGLAIFGGMNIILGFSVSIFNS